MRACARRGHVRRSPIASGEGRGALTSAARAVCLREPFTPHSSHRSGYDAAVSGADPIDTRPGFKALLAYCETHSVGVVLVENASRFARDLAVQLTGHALLRARGIELVPVDAPT